MNFHIMTLFPEMVVQGLQTSILGRAMQNGHISIEAVNIRDYTQDKHKKVDDYPYGGGAGMLMQAQPVFDAYCDTVKKINEKQPGERNQTQEETDDFRPRTIYLTPQGSVFNQAMAEELARERDLIFLCGHYEGIDERVLEETVTDYVSIGDYVLTGGELPAMVMIDAIARLVPGVLNNENSAETESFSNFLLEYPQYSRPEQWHGKKVPEVLLSGDHKKISRWRLEQSIERTKARRPDLYACYERLMACRENLMRQKLLHIDMIELINRGQAVLFYESLPGNVLIRDKLSGAWFMTAFDEDSGLHMLEIIKTEAEEKKQEYFLVVSHQEFMKEHIQKKLGMKVFNCCFQAVYTRREPVRVRKTAQVRPLEESHAGTVAEHYKLTDRDYIEKRIRAGAMWGAFVEEELAGFIGLHEEGSVGMLEVLPKYRRQGIAMTLEAAVINRLLEWGYIPYGQVETDNEASKRLQEKLGHCFSREKVYWFEK